MPSSGERDTPSGRPRRLPIGAEVGSDGVHFRVWAPRPRRVEVVLHDGPGRSGRRVPMAPEEGGYHSAFVPGIGAGTLYRYQLDGDATLPDPASRRQPEGPHGPSEVVDPGAYSWRDDGWNGVRRDGLVLYEIHVGTFTPEGTFAAAIDRLPALARLGVTCLELMPVAEFPGRFGWGYDGVDLFAPYHGYGTPDDLRRLVDAAHGLGLGVILDVVYNHFGPEGSYHRAFAEAYLHPDRSPTEWGEALNFDGPDSGPVREFFLANTAYWIDEFHFDGLRLDATQAIDDRSPEHLIAAVARTARRAARGRSVVIIGENEPQNARQLDPPERGGRGLDALVNDDFHHSAYVALTGTGEAYYSEYGGTPQELISAVRWGWLFQGQFSRWAQKPRGTPATHLDASRFVNYLESHDQVANSARGRRLKDESEPGSYRAMVALWLLAPQPVMIFQGQEYGTSRPFHYFGDCAPEIGRMMAEGRREQMAQFPSCASPESAASLPDPTAEATFLAAKLEPDGRDAGPTWELFRDLLALRRDDPFFARRDSQRIAGAVLGPAALVLRYGGDGEDCRLVVVNLGRDVYPAPPTEPLLAPPVGMAWSARWSSEDPRYGGRGSPPLAPRRPWRIAGHSAMVLAPAPDPAPRPPVEKPVSGPLPIERDEEIHPNVRRQRFGP
jgi:maltooligosyltrehalose trehalohydrolase